jgi:hypothetical protein
MSHVLSLRLQGDQLARLKRLARRAGHTPSKAAAMLIEEALRMHEFTYVEFRDSALGRQAYVRGSRVTIWMLEWIARGYDHDPARVAEHLNWPVSKVLGGLEYAKAFPEEVNDAIAEHEAADFASLKRVLPQAELVVVTAADPDEAAPRNVPTEVQGNVASASR